MNPIAAAVPFGLEAVALGRGRDTIPPREWAQRFRALSARLVQDGDGAACYHCEGAGYLGPGDGVRLCETCNGVGKTYTHKAPPCPRCDGVQWVRLVPDAEIGHPAFGKGGPCPRCSGGTARMVLAQADVPAGYRGFTFESFFDLDLTDSQRVAADAARDFATDPTAFEASIGKRALLLEGPVGTCKTGICVAALAVAADWCAGGARYVHWLALQTRINASYSAGDGGETKRDILADLGRATLLILDDFGVSARGTSPAAADVGYELIEARYMGGRHTLITTNLDAAGIEREFGPQVASRIAGMAAWLHVDGADARRGAAA